MTNTSGVSVLSFAAKLRVHMYFLYVLLHSILPGLPSVTETVFGPVTSFLVWASEGACASATSGDARKQTVMTANPSAQDAMLLCETLAIFIDHLLVQI